jgi:uncharacterized protein YraI
MRSRHWALPLALLALAALLLVAAACSPQATPAPAAASAAKALRPTFTPTAVRTKGIVLAATSTRRPTMTPDPALVATATPPVTPTVAAPTAAAKAAFTVNNATVNVRGGPGTNYSLVGQVSQGQQYDITGKSADGAWWQFSYNGQPAWVTADLVAANATDSVQVAADIPAAPTARPVAAQPPAAPAPPARPVAPAPTAAPAAPPTKYALTELSPRFNNGRYITVRCRLSTDMTNGIAGTLRVMRNGASVGEASFNTVLTWANGGMTAENRYIYNDGCKVEFSPVVEGEYTAVLVEGGQPVSDVASFTVTGDNHEFVVIWRPR